MFKSVWVYGVASGWPASIETVEEALQCMPFVPCGASQDKAVGWVPPRGQAHGPLIESVNGQWMLRFKVEVRQVPSSVINRRVNDMAAQIEATTGRKPGKKEKRDLKEEAVAALLPQAFPREQSIWVWLDTTHHRMVLDSTSAARADDIITALVKVLDGFSVEPLSTALSPAVAMATWLTEQEAPAGFAIGKECELKSADESQAVVRYARHPLLTDEVKAHLAQGKQPTRLALEWDDRVSFVLGDNLQLKKLAFDDKVLEQAKAQGQRADDFDGNVLMVTAELSPLIGDLIDALDGLAVPGGTPAPAQAEPSTAPAPAASAATDDDDPPF
ncbi:MAG: recombination-associated protein RdgC [Burkholderiaceae bacterium]